jgi:aldehyde:ferredoxin oxidoreductase
MHVKGLELPAYDVRGAKAHGLNYATAYSGADHNRGYAFQEIFSIPVPHEVDRLCHRGQGRADQMEPGHPHRHGSDCPTMCVFLLDMAVAAGGRTEHRQPDGRLPPGSSSAPEDVQIAGETDQQPGQGVQRISEGFTRADDTSARTADDRAVSRPAHPRGSSISQADLDAMLDEYYSGPGLGFKSGAPTKEKLEQLGLAYAAKYLAG